jgi:hypothetical protein
MSPDGTALRQSLAMKEMPSEHAAAFEELQSLYTERDRLQKIADDFYAKQDITDADRAKFMQDMEQYNDIHDRIWELEGQLHDQKATKLLVDLEGQNDVAAPTEPVTKPGMHPWEEEARQQFGTTQNSLEAGYLMPNGDMLDLSGRSQASGYENINGEFRVQPGKRDFLANNRALDHRDIWQAMGDEGGGTEGMHRYMAESGAVRMHDMGDTVAVNVASALTDAQKQAILRITKGKEVSWEITDPKTGYAIASGEAVHGGQMWDFFREAGDAFGEPPYDPAADITLLKGKLSGFKESMKGNRGSVNTNPEFDQEAFDAATRLGRHYAKEAAGDAVTWAGKLQSALGDAFPGYAPYFSQVWKDIQAEQILLFTSLPNPWLLDLIYISIASSYLSAL